LLHWHSRILQPVGNCFFRFQPERSYAQAAHRASHRISLTR
jgi:hypothetical protein